MNEAHMREIENVLLYVTEARQRAERACGTLAEDGAERHLVRALEQTVEVMRDEHRRLMQATYWAVPQQKMAV